jgi:membrane protein required for colicin V production
MNSLDLVLLALTALSAVAGLWRGVIRESFVVLAWLAGFPIASQFAPDVRRLLNLSDLSPALAYMLAWVIVFLAVWLICQLISAVLSGMLSFVGLGIFNRILGGVFGLTRAALSLMVLTIIVGLTPAASYPLWQSSWVVQMAKQGIVFFKPFLPAPMEGWVF